MTDDRKRFYTSMVILALMFFIFGFVSWMNSILIPYFRVACELTHFQSYLVTFAFYIAYFVMAVPSGKLLDRVGFKRGIMYGFMCMAVGAFIFVPAALAREFWIFLIGLFSIGTGLAILQTAANPYVTIIGPIDSAARRMSIMGVCNKFAGIISPLVFAALVLNNSGDSEMFAQIESGLLAPDVKEAMLDELIRRVIWPYTILGVILLAAGIWIRHSVLPEIDTAKDNASEAGTETGRRSVFSYPYLVLGAVAIFFHVGSQVVAIDTIIGYAGDMGLDMIQAKAFPSYTLTFTLIGYLCGIVLIPKFVSQTRAFQFCVTLGLVLSLCVIFVDAPMTVGGHQVNASIMFLSALGLPNSLIYAGIWPLAIHNLGRHTKTGSSLLIMGLCGNAIMPQLYGLIADHVNLRAGYWVLVPCFLYLMFYAFWGHKIQNWKKTEK